MTDILQSIGFTSNHCLVSYDIIPLLNTLHNDKTTYLSLLPSEIFKVIIENLYINLEFHNVNKKTFAGLVGLKYKYHGKYILITNKNMNILINNINSSDHMNMNYRCNGFIIKTKYYLSQYIWKNTHFIQININDKIQFSFFKGKYSMYLHVFKLDAISLYIVKPDNNDDTLIKNNSEILHRIIIHELS